MHQRGWESQHAERLSTEDSEEERSSIAVAGVCARAVAHDGRRCQTRARWRPAIVLFAVIGIAAAMANRGSVDYDALSQRLRRKRPHRDAFREEPREDEPLRRAAIIVNPTRFDDLSDIRARIAGVCAAQGWVAPICAETTAEQPGTAQA